MLSCFLSELPDQHRVMQALDANGGEGEHNVAALMAKQLAGY
ncbi:hypothetical protein [Thiothrix unzii]|jgi:hypothetical protein|nr:hypothetical protein [Thiothrix unzii]MDX9989675.1 hypothetical protein [Thiothrix unzii]